MLDLLGRIELRIDPDQHGGSAEPWLRVTGGGTAVTAQAVLARGAAENRLSAGEIRAKFDQLAARRLPAGVVRRLADGIGALPAKPDVAGLVDLLATGDAPRTIAWANSDTTVAAIPA